MLDNIRALLRMDADVLCLSRFHLGHAASLDLSAYHREFAASMPHGAGDQDIGILTLHRGDCEVTHRYFDHIYHSTDVDQGNIMSVIDTGDHRLLHCLPCFGEWPIDMESPAWRASFAQTQQIFDEAAGAESVIVGNMHIESQESRYWDRIDRYGYVNRSELYNTYKSENGTCLNMQQIWSKDVEIREIWFPLNIIKLNRALDIPYHVPLMFETLH